MPGLWSGLSAVAPLVPGVVAFGLVYGVVARQAGLSLGAVTAMSVLVFAGAAQFAAVGMWGQAGGGLIVLTTFVINLRHVLMGASVAPYLRGQPGRWKALLAFGMVDESYALAISRYLRGDGSREFFLGANLGLYASWVLSSLAGGMLGGLVVAESPPGKRIVRLALKPGQYLVRRRLGQRMLSQSVTISPGSAAELREEALEAAARDPWTAKGADPRPVTMTVVPRGSWDVQLAVGVRHAPVIDPGLRLTETASGGAAGIFRLTFGLGGGWHVAAPAAVAFAPRTSSAVEWIYWGGIPVVSLAKTAAATSGGRAPQIVAGLVGVGSDARWQARDDISINGSLGAFGSWRWSTQPDARTRPDSWSAQASLGISYSVMDAVSQSLGAAAGANFLIAGSPADARDERNLLFAFGSVQRRGLRPLPLVRIHLSDALSLDGHVVVAYASIVGTFTETYLAGLSWTH
jgi:hypothetical protein